MSAQVKAGYKQTGVGIIPAEWAVSTITEAAEMTTVGFVGSMSHLFTQNGVPVLRGQDVLPNMLDASDTKFISNDTHQLWIKSALKGGDVVMVRVGASAGTSCVIPDNLGEANAASIVVIRPLKKRLDANFLSEIINSDFGKRQVESLLVGGAQPVINTATVAAFQIPLPPVTEQRAIAAALSDMDALICGLDQLIAKKRDIKQAAMQQLLTGQQRLPGFSGEWEMKRFVELATPRKDRVDPRKSGEESFCIELEHIDQGTGRLLGNTTTSALSSLKTTFKADDVLFGKLRAYLRKFWLADCQGTCSTEIWPLVANRNLTTPGFLIQLVRDDCFIEAASTTYGTHMPRSDWNVIKNYEVRIPCIAEQIAIATILSDMDSELAALEVRRDKARELKQGMMQELLSGRIRLVSPGEGPLHAE